MKSSPRRRTHTPVKGQRGFTLIELLVVIAIVALLSAVVLAALNATRGKGKDAAIKSEVLQLRTLATEEFVDNGSYDALKGNGDGSTGWFATTAQCTTPSAGFTGNYGPQAKQVCSSVITNEAGACPGGYECLYSLGTATYSPSSYSIMAWLPGAQAWLCEGSSGTTGIYPSTAYGTGSGSGCTGGGTMWCMPGCFGSP